MIHRAIRTTAALLLGLTIPVITPAFAQDVNPVPPGITVGHGWTYLSTADGKSTPAYFTIHNAGSTPDTLVSTSCPVAHHTVLLDPSGKTLGAITINPGQTIMFSPSGTHLMLEQNRFRFYAHAMIPCSVDFLSAGKLIIYLHVEPDSAKTYEQARRPIVND
ncbi:MAG: copper chaperone PCu(A)C [Acidiphilium sp.]|nr:copper chaperone PCu(A)C [Acidiphilium sp.]MDD4934772.1 copper chaperone PCu(A)C [Acidiphilium sp.]